MSELVARGHTIRLLSRHAVRESPQWPAGVEALDGSVTEPASMRGAADGCAAVVHMAVVVTQSGEATFQRVNVEGTRNVVREAERAGGVAIRLLAWRGSGRLGVS
ncbi:MAG: NAD(P)H-binding protein [Gemmatimonadaceae bacterium]